MIATLLAGVIITQHSANACEPVKKEVVKKKVQVTNVNYSPFTQLLTI